MDIQEQEQLIQILKRREAFLAKAQRLSHAGSFGWRASTGELIWSEEALRILEFDRTAIPTLEPLLHRVHPEDATFVKQTIECVLPGAKEFDLECRLQMPNGSVKYVHMVAHAEIDESGELEFVGSVMDITASKEAEDRIRRIINTFQLWSARPDGWIDFISQRWLEYTGMTMEQMLGWGWEPAFHHDDLEQVTSKWRAALAERKALETEARLRRFDGEYRWFLFRAFPLFDRIGQVLAWYGGNTDIHDRKQAEEKVRQDEMELRQVLDLTPQHIYVLGTDRSRMYANQAVLNYLGQTLEEWRRCDPRSLIHTDDWARFWSEGHSKYVSDVAHESEVRVRRNDGTYRWCLHQRSPLRDERGRITRWYVSATDIEDRKQAEEKLKYENVALREEIDKTSMFEEIVGSSPALKAVLARVTKVAPTDSTVFITGETGTGKELIARAIHKRSKRSSRAFVSVNCAAIPASLIASELFGHEKGAFTGAHQRRLGRFELAEGGTIFLDEIGELQTETQIALLRVLQEHEFERVGGNQVIRSNVRVITATNRDLKAAVEDGIFRRDLFYRLNVFPIEIPPLRERKEDIPLLIEYFIARYANRAGKKIRGTNKKTLDLLQSYPWRGNIRELQNVIERSIIVCDTETFSVDESWLVRDSRQTQSANQPLSDKLLTQEKEMIEAALAESRGRVSGPQGAAAKLGLPPTTLESKIRSLKINKHCFKPS